jgi:hypothetical protein
MTFLVAMEGMVAYSSIKTVGGAPASVPQWPKNGAFFKGEFRYTPSPTPTPTLFPKIYVDFGSFTITRSGSAGSVSLVNGGAGIAYSDPFSTGFNNVSLPGAGWQLEAFGLTFANPTGLGTANPAALDFNLFAERTISASGNNGSSGSSALVWNILARIDVVIVLPA